jgi:hypothetical protein
MSRPANNIFFNGQTRNDQKSPAQQPPAYTELSPYKSPPAYRSTHLSMTSNKVPHKEPPTFYTLDSSPYRAPPSYNSFINNNNELPDDEKMTQEMIAEILRMDQEMITRARMAQERITQARIQQGRIIHARLEQEVKNNIQNQVIRPRRARKTLAEKIATARTKHSIVDVSKFATEGSSKIILTPGTQRTRFGNLKYGIVSNNIESYEAALRNLLITGNELVNAVQEWRVMSMK